MLRNWRLKAIDPNAEAFRLMVTAASWPESTLRPDPAALEPAPPIRSSVLFSLLSCRQWFPRSPPSSALRVVVVCVVVGGASDGPLLRRAASVLIFVHVSDPRSRSLPRPLPPPQSRSALSRLPTCRWVAGGNSPLADPRNLATTHMRQNRRFGSLAVRVFPRKRVLFLLTRATPRLPFQRAGPV